MTTERTNVKRMTRIALCAALIAVCTFVTIPMPAGVPITLQTFGVALCGFLLTPLEGIAAVLVYLLLGAAGVPVFSGMMGGPAVLVGKTGGFLFGFLLMVLCCGIAKKQPWRLLSAGLGLLLCHLVGVTQFALLTGTGFWASAMLVSVPFLLKDILSIVLAQILAHKLVPLLRSVLR